MEVRPTSCVDECNDRIISKNTFVIIVLTVIILYFLGINVFSNGTNIIENIIKLFIL